MTGIDYSRRVEQDIIIYQQTIELLQLASHDENKTNGNERSPLISQNNS